MTKYNVIFQRKKLTKIKPENIYAHENDDRIYKFLKFNSNIANLDLDNIQKGDTFDYSDYLKHNENLYDKVITNPPFGMSIDILLSTTDKSKLLDYLKKREDMNMKNKYSLQSLKLNCGQPII